MKVWTVDIGNAYLEATTREKLNIVAGPEFEELQGHILVIHKALYGLKSSGSRWSQGIHDIMLELRPCKVDPFEWLRENSDPVKLLGCLKGFLVPELLQLVEGLTWLEIETWWWSCWWLMGLGTLTSFDGFLNLF